MGCAVVPCCWGGRGVPLTGLRSTLPKPGRLTRPDGAELVEWMLEVGLWLTRSGWRGGGSGFCMPPRRDPDPLDSSFDVKSDTLEVGLRGIVCLALALTKAGNCPESDAGAVFVGEADARWAGFLATGGPGLDLSADVEAGDACDTKDAELGATGKVCDLVGMGCDGVCAAVCLLGGGGGGASFLLGLRDVCSSARPSRPTLAGNAAWSNGGGSFLGAELDAEVDSKVEWLICS